MKSIDVQAVIPITLTSAITGPQWSGEDAPAAGGHGAVTVRDCRECGSATSGVGRVFSDQEGESVEEPAAGAGLAAVDEQEPTAGENQGGGHRREVRRVGGCGVLDDHDLPRRWGMSGQAFGELVEATLVGTRRCGGYLDEAPVGAGGGLAHRVGEGGGVAVGGQCGHDVGS